jgi:hypothetical protein
VSLADPTYDEPRSRSERVRARRAQLHRPAETVRRRRAAEGGRHSRPRRVREVAWPTEIGARLRLPALPAFRTGARLISLTLACLTIWVLASAFRSPEFRVVRAEVAGSQMLDGDRVRSIAGVDGTPVFQVDPETVRRRLLAQPEIQSASLRIRWPNLVQIDVVERQPLVAWNDDGRRWWLSDDGLAFLPHGEGKDLVHIDSDNAVLNIQRDPLAPVVDPEVLWAAAALHVQVPDVDPLRYDPEHGLGFDDPLGWKAYFGESGDMVLKVQLYRKIAQALQVQGVQAEWVSVEDPASPYYRVKRD